MNTILVDDHNLFRIGLKSVLSKHIPDSKIIAECANANELFDTLEKNAKVDIIILDIVMPGINGIMAAKKIKNSRPNLPILVVSSELNEQTAIEISQVGVDGYLSKVKTTEEEIVEAVKTVCNGSPFYAQNIDGVLYDIYLTMVSNEGKEATILSEREVEVTRLLCEGLSCKEVAAKLFLSTRTVEWHKKHIMEKMGFKTTSDLIKYAIRNGIICL